MICGSGWRPQPSPARPKAIVSGPDRDGDGIRADLSDPGATAAALSDTLRSGPITRLVNNVGVVRPGPVEGECFTDLN